jgi:PhzF family phenazine biosynthesis protein
MSTYRFMQVDVFTDRPLLGNPGAVVLGADGLDPDAMQRLAAWTNLSETTFVLRLVRVAEGDGAIEIGGSAVTVVEGEVRL